MSKTVLCPAGTPTLLIRNIAARGRARTFVVRLSHGVGGSVEVRSGPLPFFLGASRQMLALSDGLTVHRGFFDASFEVIVSADQDVNVRLD